MRTAGQRLAESAGVRFLRARPFVADLLLGLGLLGFIVLVLVNLDDEFMAESAVRPDGWTDWLLAVSGSLVVPFRRIAPVPAVVVGGVLQVAVWLSSLPDTSLPLMILLYSATAHRSAAARWAGWGVATALSLFTVSGVASGEIPPFLILFVGVLGFGSATLGAVARSRQLNADAAEARAEELERSRTRDRDRALVEERARIARELHDVVAHGLSVIVVQASGALSLIHI